MAAILDTVALPRDNDGTELAWRDHRLPLLDLGQAFGSRPQQRRQGYVVVVEGGGRLLGLMVGGTRGPLEIMVRGLDDLLRGLPGISGSSVLGDGSVVLILDPQGLVGLRDTVGEPA